MNIEITGETEQLIKAALASGAYATAEEFVAAMAGEWKRDLARGKVAVIPAMRDQIDLATLLAEQNVIACERPDELKTDLWPQSESTDEFLAFLRETRHDRIDLSKQP